MFANSYWTTGQAPDTVVTLGEGDQSVLPLGKVRAVKRSTDRILSTHTGSFSRPSQVLDLLAARKAGLDVNERLAAELETSVRQVVHDQITAGIDVISDGEQSKSSFSTYALNRLTGFTQVEAPASDWRVSDAQLFPEWAKASGGLTRTTQQASICTGSIHYVGKEELVADIDRFKAALAREESVPTEAFLPSVSVGTIAHRQANQHYDSDEAYLFALADAMSEEYQAITDAGLVLQVDAPDVANDYERFDEAFSPEQYRSYIGLRVEALNHALAQVPREQVRFHVCWGNYEGPHVRDIPLKEIVGEVLRVRAGAYSVEAANPRHEHEWRVWQSVKLPADAVLIPGVIDDNTSYVEHPELVAERIVRFATLVGRENVIAGVDCGFGTGAARNPRVHPTVVWAKLRSLAEGARLASEELWRR